MSSISLLVLSDGGSGGGGGSGVCCFRLVLGVVTEYTINTVTKSSDSVKHVAEPFPVFDYGRSVN